MMRKGTSVCLPVDDKIFNSAETDYQSLVLDKLFQMLGDATPSVEFDPDEELREFLDDGEPEAEAEAEEEDEPAPAELPDISEMNAKQAVVVVQGFQGDAEALARLADMERAGKERKTVLDAIEAAWGE